jgi:hypothetical protein
MRDMARKKSGRGKSRHADPRESFHLPTVLQLAVECAAALPDLPTNKSAVIRRCLEEVLKREGWLPLSDDNLRALLGKVRFKELSPHAQRFLRDRGLTPGKVAD